MKSSIKSLIMLLVTAAGPVLGQVGTVTGRIQNTHQQVLPGITIRLEGLTIGAITNEQGDFTLRRVPAGTYTLTASGVGLEAQKQNVVVQAGQITTLNLQLNEATNLLSEVVVSAGPNTDYTPEPITSVATRLDVPLLETPQAIQVIPKQLWQDQVALNVNEVSRNMVGVANASNYNDFIMRGFRNYYPGTFMVTNGLRGNVYHYSQPVLLYNVEQMEVLRGPASVLYANNTPGGVINLTTKQPLATPRYEVNLTTGSWKLLTGFVDATGPLSADKRLKYRLVAGGETSESFRNFQYRKNLLINPTLRYDWTDNTSITADFTYLRMNTQAEYDRGTFVRRNADGNGYDWRGVDRSFATQGPDSEGRDRNWATSLNFQHRFSQQVSVAVLSRYVDRTLYMFEAAAATGLRNDSIPRYGDTWNFHNTWWNNTAYVTVQFQTGKGLRHQLLIGADYIEERWLQNLYISKALPTLSVLNPDFSQDKAIFFNPATPIDYADDNTNYTRNVAGYVQDQISIGEKVSVNLALRYNRYNYRQEPTSELDAENAVVESDADAWVPRLGIVYNPLKNLAFYGSYTESFEPQFTNSVGTGGPFPPRKGKQYEVGYKGDFWKNRLSTSLAWYFIDYVNVLATDPADPQQRRQILVPGLTSTGIEVAVQGNLLDNLSVMANYATMNVKYTENSPLGRKEQRPFNTPKYVGNLWLKYQFVQHQLKGLGVGAGVSFQGDKVGQSRPYDAQFVLPAWQTVDATVDYRWQKYRLAVNLSNLLDKQYFTGAYSTALLMPGTPRNVRVNLSAVF